MEPGEDASSFRAIVGDSTEFVDECCFRAQGFVAYAATVIAGAPVQVTSSRPGPDRLHRAA